MEAHLARIGRVSAIGSYRTGLMVWRDLDFSVDAPAAAADDVWNALLPLLVRSRTLHYEDDDVNDRYYFVVVVGGWKLDVSVWRGGVPDGVEEFQEELAARIAADPRLRTLLLRLKDEWYADPAHDRTVGYEIYRAVLDHGVSSVAELERHLA